MNVCSSADILAEQNETGRSKNPTQQLTKEQHKACLDSAAAELIHEITHGGSFN
jgi:hypothetical protein